MTETLVSKTRQSEALRATAPIPGIYEPMPWIERAALQAAPPPRPPAAPRTRKTSGVTPALPADGRRQAPTGSFVAVNIPESEKLSTLTNASGTTITERPNANGNGAPARSPSGAMAVVDEELSGILSDILESEEETKRRKAEAEQPPRSSRETWFTDIFEARAWAAVQGPSRKRHVAREVAFLERALTMKPGAQVLDVGCGDGAHALELAQAGYRMVAMDLSHSLLEEGLTAANRRGLTIRFVEADMRELTIERQFDGVVCLNSTFGYFDDAENLRVLRAMSRALKPGGIFVLDVVNRDWIVMNTPRRVWWESDAALIMEEVNFLPESSRVHVKRSLVREGYANWDQYIEIRVYSMHELESLLRVAGLRVLDVTGDLAHPGVYLGPQNRRLVIRAVRER